MATSVSLLGRLAHSEGIHHEAGKITPERVLRAILAANAIGEYRKSHPG